MLKQEQIGGLGKASGKWSLACLVHNIRKICAKVMAKGDDLDSLTGKLEAAYNVA